MVTVLFWPRYRIKRVIVKLKRYVSASQKTTTTKTNKQTNNNNNNKQPLPPPKKKKTPTKQNKTVTHNAEKQKNKGIKKRKLE